MQAGKGSKQACPEAVADGRALGEQFTSPFPRRAGGKAVRSLMQVSSVLLYCRWLAGAGAISSARPSWAGCNLLVQDAGGGTGAQSATKTIPDPP